MDSATLTQKALQLTTLATRLPFDRVEQWGDVEAISQTIANELRVLNVDHQSALGHVLPQTLSGILKGATEGAITPDQGRKKATFEILRVGANLCRDHDENRSFLLESGFPQTVVSLLEGYADHITLNDGSPMKLSILDLQVVKTAIGVLLNTSAGYEPVKKRLISLEAAMTVLKLSIAIYPPGSWLWETHLPVEGTPETTDVRELWNLRSSLATWAWLTISELEDDDDSERPRQLFTADILPHLTRTLERFVPPFPPPPPLFSTPESRKVLSQIDMEVLEQATSLLEILALDIDEVKIALARDYVSSPVEGGASMLARMISFIERGDYPHHWSDTPAPPIVKGKQPVNPEEDRAARKKGFDMSKAAVIKAVVETAGEDKNTNVLWNDSKAARNPGGSFVNTMVRWVREHKDFSKSQRDDLLICALVNLGNLCRAESHSIALVEAPIDFVPDLLPLLEPSTDPKVLHGLLGLLKHLATAAANRLPLGRAGILQKVLSSQVVSQRADVMEQLQLSAVGLVKHMCNGSADNATITCLPLPDTNNRTLLECILDLGQRSDSVAIKSESTRVLVNAIKSLWASDPSSFKDSDVSQRRHAARKALVNANTASALAQLIGRSRKYPMLVNEGVVALTLLSTGENGGATALDALMNPLPAEASTRRAPSLPVSAGGILSDPDGSPAIPGPRRAFDMLVSFLQGAASNTQAPSQSTSRSAPPVVPAEVIANTCTLFAYMGKRGVVINRDRDVEVLKENTGEVLKTLANTSSGSTNKCATAAKLALEVWNKP